MKKRLLIFSPNIVTTNYYFIQSKSFEEMTNIYDIYVYYDAGLKGSDVSVFQNRGFKGIYGYTVSPKRKQIWSTQLFVNLIGARKLSRDFSIIYNMMGRSYGNVVHRSIHRILGSSYLTTKLTNYLFEQYAGEDKAIASIIADVRPDLIVTFLGGASPLETESIKAGKKAGIPVIGIQIGWDQISTRGIMPFAPDYMGVWGYQSLVFAQKIHNMPPEKIFYAGAPFTNTLKTPSVKPLPEIRKELKLPEDKRVILFAGGGGKNFNESCNLKLLDRAIEAGTLSNTCVFYRPHPIYYRRLNDLNFFDQDFKHIYLDPSLADQYRLMKTTNKKMELSRTSVPIDFEYKRDVLAISSAVVTPQSTVMLEGAIAGVPCVEIMYLDKADRRFYPANEVEHVSILKSMPGMFRCLKPDDLVSTCIKAMRFSEDRLRTNLMKKHVSAIIYDDELGFTKRLENVIRAIFNPEELSAFHFLNDPVPRTREEMIVHDWSAYIEDTE